MKILARMINPVELSYVKALLKDAGIEYLVMDTGINSVEGNLGIFPQRVMVLDDDLSEARSVLTAAGISYDDPA